MFKKINAMVDNNRDDLLVKGVMLGGITLGLIGGSVIDKLKSKTPVVVNIVNDAPTSEPEAPKAEEN